VFLKFPFCVSCLVFLAHDCMLSALLSQIRLSIPAQVDQSKTVERIGSYNFHHTVASSLSCLRYKFYSEIPTGSPRVGASNEGGLGKRANIVGVLTLSPGGSRS